ncbi:hypothetical protein M378DRAFT_14611 [Amanita muscaria Koide BX008]|uniref:Uncharacterized protein n=1 Tax=Amanita muscaria (strain Koide BX008) TaxID=946122 RepID=A0A0C2WEE1_AMAMK|nr:hypothetical protein M378DRAFT_14611 [Amanita muscaria Koide BX008]
MPQSSVERASSANYGRYSDLIVDPMEDTTTRSSSPVTTRVPKTATVSLYPETPFSYTFLCLQNIFSKNVSDEHRAQALYQVFIEIASEIETTSQFKNVMARIAENLGQLGCKAKPCTLHCDRKLYPSLPPSPTKMDIDIKSEISAPSTPKVSLPQRALSTSTHAPTYAHILAQREASAPTPSTSQRAFSAPAQPTQQQTAPELRAHTAPPLLSRNTLTARRCTSKGPSPVSYVKFLDVPYLTKEQYLETLKESTKWSMAKVSCIETFRMKTKDGNWNIKVGFKDDAQSTIVKKLLTTSITFGSDTRRCRPWYLQTRSSH